MALARHLTNQAIGLSRPRNLRVGAIIRHLYIHESREEQCDHDLAVSLDRLCGAKVKAGDIPCALAAYEEGLRHEDEVRSRGFGP